MTLFGTNKSKQKRIYANDGMYIWVPICLNTKKKLIIQKQVHVEFKPMYILEGLGRGEGNLSLMARFFGRAKKSVFLGTLSC